MPFAVILMPNVRQFSSAVIGSDGFWGAVASLPVISGNILK